MTLVDDLKIPVSDEEITRRRAFGIVGAGALSVAAVGLGAATLSFLRPAVTYEEERRITIGRPEDMAPGSVRLLPAQRIYVVRSDAGFYALSAVCTHLGCVTRRRTDGSGFTCPCHGSRFKLDGTVEGGPAPKPLARLHLALEDGLLVVDAGRAAPPDAVLSVLT